MSLKSSVLELMLAASVTVIAGAATPADAAVMTYGDADCLGFGCYGASDPTVGAILQGLAARTTSHALTAFAHPLPPFPGTSDFAGTDTIFAGSHMTHANDGYAASGFQVAGPQVLTLDYSGLVAPGAHITSLTFGLAADDFQFPHFGQTFMAKVNGVANADLTGLLNGINLGGPSVEFFTIGLDVSLLDPSNVLTISIDEGGDGGDGWAVDFATVGVTAENVTGVPEPMTLSFFGIGLAGTAAVRRRRMRGS